MPLKRRSEDDIKLDNEKRYQEHCKMSLQEKMKTKFKTTMIGTIASLEEEFGYLWGHGLDDEELTEEEFRMREIWERVRTAILDKGNNQLRGALAELNNYTVSYNKHQYQFQVMKKNKNDLIN